MTNVLILGASDRIAEWVVEALARGHNTHQTRLMRDPKKLRGSAPANAKVVIGKTLFYTAILS